MYFSLNKRVIQLIQLAFVPFILKCTRHCFRSWAHGKSLASRLSTAAKAEVVRSRGGNRGRGHTTRLSGHQEDGGLMNPLTPTGSRLLHSGIPLEPLSGESRGPRRHDAAGLLETANTTPLTTEAREVFTKKNRKQKTLCLCYSLTNWQQNLPQKLK